jgi:hypothetical protein
VVLPTWSKASLGLGNWDAVERNVRAYAWPPTTPRRSRLRAPCGSSPRCGTWTSPDRGRGLVNILRARLMAIPDGGLELGRAALQRLRAQPEPDPTQLEAVLGTEGPQTYRWWRTGLDRALAVAAIRQQLGSRIGTGFLVRAGDLGRTPGDELLVMTNFHVVNEHGASPGIRPDAAEVVFEAVDANRAYAVGELSGLAARSP